MRSDRYELDAGIIEEPKTFTESMDISPPQVRDHVGLSTITVSAGSTDQERIAALEDERDRLLDRVQELTRLLNEANE